MEYRGVEIDGSILKSEKDVDEFLERLTVDRKYRKSNVEKRKRNKENAAGDGTIERCYRRKKKAISKP